MKVQLTYMPDLNLTSMLARASKSRSLEILSDVEKLRTTKDSLGKYFMELGLGGITKIFVDDDTASLNIVILKDPSDTNSQGAIFQYEISNGKAKISYAIFKPGEEPSHERVLLENGNFISENDLFGNDYLQAFLKDGIVSEFILDAEFNHAKIAPAEGIVSKDYAARLFSYGAKGVVVGSTNRIAFDDVAAAIRKAEYEVRYVGLEDGRATFELTESTESAEPVEPIESIESIEVE